MWGRHRETNYTYEELEAMRKKWRLKFHLHETSLTRYRKKLKDRAKNKLAKKARKLNWR